MVICHYLLDGFKGVAQSISSWFEKISKWSIVATNNTKPLILLSI